MQSRKRSKELSRVQSNELSRKQSKSVSGFEGEPEEECEKKLFQNVNYKKLGQGIYAEIIECGPRKEKHQSNECQRFALKKIAKKLIFENKEHEYPKQFWVSEYEILKHLHNTLKIKSVPIVYDYWECPEYYYIKMQLLSNITLDSILTRLNPEGINKVEKTLKVNLIDKIAIFLDEVLEMNKAGIYNNDLHFENILWDVTTKKFYMIDFGLATYNEYRKHPNNSDIINDKNKQYADVVFVLAQLGENIKNDLLKQLPKNLQNVLQGGGKSIQKGSYKKKKRIIKINKKHLKKIQKKEIK